MKVNTGVWLSSLLLSVGVAADAAPQSVVVERGDDIVIRGCVGAANAPGETPAQPTLVWTRGDIMLSNPTTIRAGEALNATERVFYWLDDDEDLSTHIGRMVEITGDLGDFEVGELDIERDGAFTNIELELDGKRERARIPTSWLGSVREGEFDIASRKVDVDEVKVLGSCGAR